MIHHLSKENNIWELFLICWAKSEKVTSKEESIPPPNKKEFQAIDFIEIPMVFKWPVQLVIKKII